MANKQIIFTKKDTAELLETEDRKPQPGEVRVKTAVSSISSGTERANITGDLNTNIYAPPAKKAGFPRFCGYSSAGIAEEVGEGVESIKPGDRVVMYASYHKLFNVLPERNVIKIEDENISFEEAALCHIGNFPLAAVRKTRLEIGESALIMGLGTLGLLAVQFARAAGAVPVIAVDPNEGRRKKALKFGADFAFDPNDKDFAKKIKECTCGGVNAAVEVTGLGIGLDECLDCMAPMGRVALLGCTRDKNFTIDYYRKVHGPGISLIGAHTMARPEHESYPGHFTHRDDIKDQLKLIAGGRVDIKSMIDEIHSPKECGEVYKRLVSEKDFPTFVQFDWRKI